MPASPSLRTRCFAALFASIGVVVCLGGTLFLMHLAEPVAGAAPIEAAQSTPANARSALLLRQS